MIKRILVALDPDPDTSVATQYSKYLASRFEAEVSGLAMVDTKQIASEVGGGAIGTMYYAEKVRTQLIKIAREKALDLTEVFAQSLAETDIPHDRLIKEGIPYKHIIQAMKYHDILVIGHDSHFLYTHPKKDTHTLAQVVKKGISPTLVVPASYRNISRVLIGYDGSDPSARTLQRFAQLQPFGNEIEVNITNVLTGNRRRERHEAELLINQTAEFMHAHGFASIKKFNIDGAEPLKALLEQADLVKADLIVAGAHSVSALRQLAFGSTTAGLLEQSKLPVFLFH